MKTYLVTFASAAFQAAQRRQARTARQAGSIDKVVHWSADSWAQQEFFRRHHDVAGRRRGVGYWLWKPFIILDLLKNVTDDDVVIYWDVGRGRGYKFRTAVGPLVDWVRAADNGFLPGAYIPQRGPNSRWTKRDCFVLMNCDEKKYWDHCQIQATFSVWRRTEKSLAFLQEWLDCCCDTRLITDDPNTCGLPNLAGFAEHRHDQSILTNLVLKHEIACYGSPYDAFHSDVQKDINFLIARIRNDRMLKADILMRHLLNRGKLWLKVGLKTELERLGKQRVRSAARPNPP